MEWLQWLSTWLAPGALGLCIATYLTTRPKMKLAQMQVEGPLWTRIDALERRLESERGECDQRIAAVEQWCEAQVQALRHDRNNLRQGLSALFAMLKQHGDPALSKIVETVEEMIARGDQAIATERAAIPATKRRTK